MRASNQNFTFSEKYNNFAHILDDTTKLHPDSLQDYPDAHEEIDKKSPRTFGRTLQTTICTDADHAHG